MDSLVALENMVRVGTVRSIHSTGKSARVWFDDMEQLSGWLRVMRGGAPRVGYRVLVIYIPVADGDGFILGELA